jgi:hypothetical protein
LELDGVFTWVSGLLYLLIGAVIRVSTVARQGADVNFIFTNRVYDNSIGWPTLPTGVIIEIELDRENQAGPDIGAEPAGAAHPEFKADVEIWQFRSRLVIELSNFFFTQTSHGVRRLVP